MQTEHLKCLSALAEHRTPARAAQALAVDVAALHEAVAAAQACYGGGLVETASAMDEILFTARGQAVLAIARQSQGELDGLHRDLAVFRQKKAVAPLVDRRSVSPRRLGLPGPDAETLSLMLAAALRAPDHGRLRPWRVIEFARESREMLAVLFEQEKLRRDPLTSPQDLARARAHALRPPVLLGFVVSPVMRSPVPVQEQWLCAGAALGNVLNAAHQLDFGAIVLSGDRCFDPILSAQIGVSGDETLAGFCLLYTSPSPRDRQKSRMPSSA